MQGQLFIGKRGGWTAVLYEAPGIPRVMLSRHKNEARAAAQARDFSHNPRHLSTRLVARLREHQPDVLKRIARARQAAAK